MSVNGWLQFAIYSVILLATVRPVGIYLTRVLEGERTWLDPVLRPFERIIYKLCGVRADKEMNWREYAFAMLGFSAVSLMLTYALERLQGLFRVGPILSISPLWDPISPGIPRRASRPTQTGSSTRPKAR